MPIKIEGEFDDIVIGDIIYRHIRNLNPRQKTSMMVLSQTKEVMKYSPEIYPNDCRVIYDLYLNKIRKEGLSREDQLIKLDKFITTPKTTGIVESEYAGDIRPITFAKLNPKGSISGGFQLYSITILSATIDTFNVACRLYPIFGDSIRELDSDRRVNAIAFVFKVVLLHDFVNTKNINFNIRTLDFSMPVDTTEIIDIETSIWFATHFSKIKTRLEEISAGSIVNIPNTNKFQRAR